MHHSDHGRRRRRNSAGVLLLVLCAALPVYAQPVDKLAASLRKDYEAGQAAQVVERVKSLIKQRDKLTLEVCLVGAEAALSVGNYKDAGSLGSLASEIAGENADGNPRDPRGLAMEAHALYYRAQQAMGTGNPGPMTSATFLDAGTFYRRARQAGGDPYKLGYFEAEAFLAGGATGKALVAIDAALDKQPDNFDARMLRTRILLGLDRSAEAAQVLQDMRKKDGKNVLVARRLLQAVLATGDRSRARQTFLELIKEFPKDPGIYTPFELHFKTESPPTFLIETMEAAAKIHPPAIDCFPQWYLALLKGNAGKLEEGLSYMEVYRAQFDSHPEAHFWIGRFLTDLGQLERARSALLKANALGGLDQDLLVGGLRRLVAKLVGRNEYDPAAALQGVVLSLSQTPDDERDLGALYYNGGRTSEGIGVLERLAARSDGMASSTAAGVWNYLGLYYWGLGRSKDAEKALRKALDESPESSDALENLGLLLVESGRPEDGVKLLDRVIVQDPERQRSRYHRLRARYPSLMDAGKR